MDREARIKQLKAELAELENQPTAANQIGPVALQKITESLERIRVNYANIDLRTQDEQTIKTELQQINYSSYTAMRALEQDLTERSY